MKPLRNFSLPFSLIPLTIILLAAAVAAQERVATALDSLPSTARIDQVAISPDGAQVAYIVEGELSVTALSDETTTRIAPEQTKTREVTWSADSRRLAWLTDLPGDKPAAQLWTASADGNGALQVTVLNGYAETPRYSPDGTKLAVLYIEDIPRIAGPLQPMTPLAGVVGEKIFEQRIAVVDLKTKKLTEVSPADVYVYEYDWTPDSGGFAAIAAHGSGDNNWWIARLYSIDADGGQMREIYKPKWQIAEPHISPDGKSVAFIEGIMSDEGLTGGDVYVVPISGGAARNLTPGIKASPSSLAWIAARSGTKIASDRVAIVANVDGDSGYAVIPESGYPPEAAWKGGSGETWTSEEMIGLASDVWVPSASFSRDGSVSAVVRQAANTAPEVWAGTMGAWKQITHLNQNVKPTWGESRNVHWVTKEIVDAESINGKTPDGNTRVQGWLMFPKDYDPAKKYPLVVSVHGGPSWACVSKWSSGGMGSMTAASLLGWFVLCPNPRGSFGQGEAFTQGNVKDFGGGDYRDIMAGVDAMIKQYPIDPKRIGIRGHSYGGYMTMWAETQTHFAAAVAGAGLSDWLSYYGLNDIDEWMIPFFGASVYDDPTVYQKSDPIHFVKNVNTPTLILVGDSDGEVPMEQSLEWYHALESMKVPTQMVVYPNEGHVFYKATDARDYSLRMLRWFDEWFTKAESKN
jgi:dipeptidyl aminopeptidase/acylaminoacyl peptidase